MKIRGAPTCCRVKPERQGRHRHRQIRGAPSARFFYLRSDTAGTAPPSRAGALPRAGTTSSAGRTVKPQFPGGPSVPPTLTSRPSSRGKGTFSGALSFPLGTVPLGTSLSRRGHLPLAPSFPARSVVPRPGQPPLPCREPQFCPRRQQPRHWINLYCS